MKIEQNNYYKNNMNETIKQIMLDQIEELELKLASAHEQIMRLEKAGDGLVAGAGAVNMWERIKVWDTTKENKAINNMTEQDLLSSLGENAQSKNLTAKKTNEIMQRDKSVITGFVVTDPYGNIGIIDKSVVRWISKEQWSQL